MLYLSSYKTIFCSLQTVDLRQVRDAVSAVFHTLLLHRSVGKFQYKAESNYQLGSIGIEEVDCDFVDLTYVRVNSAELVSAVKSEVDAFFTDVSKAAECGGGANLLSSSSSPKITYGTPLLNARIALEFYQRRKRQWPLPDDQVPWEVWQLQLDIVDVRENEYFERMRENVAESLSDVVISTCGAINRPQYLPKMPTRSELSNVFDDNFSDCQPYLFRVVRHPLHTGDRTCETSTFLPSGGLSTVKKLLKDTLSF
ncbi:Autophagy-related protein [Toxocara canis]|uniref:Autophagy-related protein 101 n=1 Tax=Toxocara canis TaxID=6265 RepID=A0A0B2VGL7_TOXCA|nr:Autophagy-related protein [Toxocara canis]